MSAPMALTRAKIGSCLTVARIRRGNVHKPKNNQTGRDLAPPNFSVVMANTGVTRISIPVIIVSIKPPIAAPKPTLTA